MKRSLGFITRPALILSTATVWVLVLSVITPQYIVAAQNALPIQQISIGAGGDSPSLHLQQLQQQRHGGNFYAPQHGYDNNIEFIHDQTESIFDVAANHPKLNSDTANNNNNNREEEEDGVEPPPNNAMDNGIGPSFGGGGAGDIYLHNGAPESDPDDHRHHHLDDDESLNENQLPDDGAEEGRSPFTELDGGIIVGEKILRQSESPYVLNTDLEVERDGRLVIEAGVTIEFAAMVGITVRGVITAVVSEE